MTNTAANTRAIKTAIIVMMEKKAPNMRITNANNFKGSCVKISLRVLEIRIGKLAPHFLLLYDVRSLRSKVLA